MPKSCSALLECSSNQKAYAMPIAGTQMYAASSHGRAKSRSLSGNRSSARSTDSIKGVQASWGGRRTTGFFPPKGGGSPPPAKHHENMDGNGARVLTRLLEKRHGV